MEFSITTWMLLFFFLFLIISIWKIAAFLPNKALEDDDTTQDATNFLESLMLKVIVELKGEIDENELYVAMSTNPDFDSELFWRFNLNKLKQLLNTYYVKNNLSSIKEIYEKQKN
ncbi:MAG: hypothetical protein JXQ67_01465 [Campylobacterales bacterium]|nr:hypothetical protein [Campylobacterales bacterium]